MDIRHKDINHPETLDAAFAGIERILLVSADGDNETRIRQHANAVAAAERAGIGFIAYTSLAKAQESTNLFAPTHQATENAILKTDIPTPSCATTGTWRMRFPASKVSWQALLE